jgi:hypothetical protein
MATFPGIAGVQQIDTLFDFAAAQGFPAIAVLPELRTEDLVARQLVVLSRGARWRVRRVPTPRELDTDDVFVGLEWNTGRDGVWSSPMGLAPLGTMPPTRRAPYPCIAAWTGGYANAFRTRRDPVVHFLDVDLTRYGLDAEKYKAQQRSSKAATTKLMLDDDAGNYRNVAFRLSRAGARRLAALPLATRQ